MRTERLDIRVPRNGDYYEGWEINDADGAPLDLTGVALQLAIRRVAGQGAILAAATITAIDPASGKFNVLIDGESLASVAGQSEIVRLAYDLRLTYPDGVKVIPVEGQIILTPGATY